MNGFNGSLKQILTRSNQPYYSFFLSLLCVHACVCVFSPVFAPLWFDPRPLGWDIVMGAIACDLSFPHSYSSAFVMIHTKRLSVCQTLCFCFIKYHVTSTVCLAVGVWGHANSGWECELPGYSEWPHPWKALQQYRGTYCTITSTDKDICSCIQGNMCTRILNEPVVDLQGNAVWPSWGNDLNKLPGGNVMTPNRGTKMQMRK